VSEACVAVVASACLTVAPLPLLRRIDALLERLEQLEQLEQ
jgi:hypothetical protein